MNKTSTKYFLSLFVFLLLFGVVNAQDCEPMGDNLLGDSSFDNGLDCWSSGMWGGSVGTFAANAENGNDGMNSIQIDVTALEDPVNPIQVSVSKDGVAMTEGGNYTLSFYVMSMSGNEELVNATIFSNIDGVFGQVMNQPNLVFQGDGEWHDFSFEVPAMASSGTPDFSQLTVLIGFAHNLGTYFLDDLSLVEIPDPCQAEGDNIITDASFDNGLECWTTAVWGESMGSFAANAENGNDGMNSVQIDVTTLADPPNPLQVSVSKSGIAMTEGGNYTLSFNVMSMSGNEETFNATIASNIDGVFGQVWNKPGLTFPGDGEWHNFIYEVPAMTSFGTPDYDQLSLTFGFAQNIGTYFLDAVSLVEIPDPCMTVGDNLISDSSFDNGTECWTTATWGESMGSFTANAENGNDGMNSVQVDVTMVADPPNPLQVAISKAGIAMTEGTDYTLTFNVMSMSGNEETFNATIFSNIDGVFGQVWNKPGLTFPGDGEWHNFTYDLTAMTSFGTPDYEQLSVLFGFAQNVGTYFIDDVSLVEIPDPCMAEGDNLFSDPSFDQGLTCWDSGNWGLAMATYSADPDNGNDGMNSAKIEVTAANPMNALQATLRKQVFELEVGRTYELSWHIMSNSGAEDAFTATIISDPNIGGAAAWGQVFNEQDLTFPGDGEWHNFTFEFVAGSTAGNPDFEKLSLLFGFGKFVGTYFIDDVSLISVADPPGECEFFGDNIISDPTMDVGLSCWTTGFWGAGAADFSRNDDVGSDGSNSIQIDVTSANPDNALQATVLKPMLTLVENQGYELSFNVMSNSGNEETLIATMISDGTTGGSTWGQFMNEPDLTYQGDGEWHNFKIGFPAVITAGEPSFDAAGLLFGFARTTGTFFLDEVSVMAVDSFSVSTSNFLANELNVSVVPNPVTLADEAAFIIDMPQSADLNWRLTNVTGQTVRHEKINKLAEGKHSLSFSTSNLEKGVYILVGQTDVGNFTKKVIIQ